MLDGVNVGSRSLLKLDSFSDTAGMLEDARSENQKLDEVCVEQDGDIAVAYSRDNNYIIYNHLRILMKNGKTTVLLLMRSTK